MLLPQLKKYVQESIAKFDSISAERKELLRKVAGYISTKLSSNKPVNLTFICTHNSRRSHISQLWAQVAAYNYDVPNVSCFSAGTEETAFNPRAVKAMLQAGLKIDTAEQGENPKYNVSYSDETPAILAFSKTITDSFNPQENFAAIMTCDSADEACPVVFGSNARFPIKYEDPKVADDTPEEESKYNERCRQISTEMLYMFSQVKTQNS